MQGRTAQSAGERYSERFATALIAAIEAGTAPWQKPWKPGELSPPMNFTTKRRYRGNNWLLLHVIGHARGYGDPRWAGFHQIRHAGGMVRRGEKGTAILVVRERRRRETDDSREDDRPDIWFSMEYVFNVRQADGLDLPSLTAPEPAFDPNAAVMAVAADAHVRIEHVPGDRACYSPELDFITMPMRGQFSGTGSYEHTLLHELAHATAHPSRLDRETGWQGSHGTPEYALEELRAEISAMMLGERLHVGHEPRHGEAYVANWVQRLKKDPDAVRRASMDAERIADWLTRNQTALLAEREAGGEPDRGTAAEAA